MFVKGSHRDWSVGVDSNHHRDALVSGCVALTNLSYRHKHTTMITSSLRDRETRRLDAAWAAPAPASLDGCIRADKEGGQRRARERFLARQMFHVPMESLLGKEEKKVRMPATNHRRQHERGAILRSVEGRRQQRDIRHLLLCSCWRVLLRVSCETARMVGQRYYSSSCASSARAASTVSGAIYASGLPSLL